MATESVELSAETRKALDRYNLRPLWELERNELGKTRDDLEPNIWKWHDVRSTIDHLNEDLQPEFSRRVTVPVNTAFDAAVSHTLLIGIRTISPGEAPQHHRHGGNTLRFAIDGNPKMKSTVGGETFPMNDGDLVTIPQWEWHGHQNGSQEEIIWLDAHDTPLIFDALNVGSPFEMLDDDQQPPSESDRHHETGFGAVRPPTGSDEIPGPFEGIREATPPHRFGWTEVSDSLKTVDESDNGYDPYDGVVLEYTNPARGSGPLFPTFNVRVQRLLGGKPTRAHRHNSTEVYFVISGSGRSVVGGEELQWSDRDIFIIPPGRSHYHKSDDTSTLLKLTDRALLEAINLYHEVDEE